MTSLLLLLLLIIFVEATTEIITSSDIFEKLREYIFIKNDFLGKLIHCGYCTSVWVSASVAWLFTIPQLHPVLGYVLMVLVTHRLSNLWHELIARWLGRAPIAISIFTNNGEKNENQDT